MKSAIDETNRRREVQLRYNKEHNITPKTIIKDIKNTLQISKKPKDREIDKMSRKEIVREIEQLTSLMTVASKNLEFELCIKLRDEIAELKKRLKKAK